jgi:hypothetical protein
VIIKPNPILIECSLHFLKETAKSTSPLFRVFRSGMRKVNVQFMLCPNWRYVEVMQQALFRYTNLMMMIREVIP